ncbi:GNAT family N-acetyltransferase [Pseudoxanthomonas sp. PXM03]|uniref:GNAT family N-acetyltransferase n=1 Tax=Pseudoxanthomonas sp. PXM03 TaxID=2769284 RepID=UPI00178005A3|nr:GNAT family N-acetyltransferase [Pseudoxanthomonas sp. PXM03]MBD9435877.1 GNAT family N-acetyltransferase [Pseudoxanthomonas sp. PXM03]
MANASLPAAWQHVPVLMGRHARLEPMSRDHVDGLRAALSGDALAALWFTQVPKAADASAYVDTVLAAQAEGRVLPFVVRDAGGRVVGSTRFYGLEADVPKLSIGYTWYTPDVQRTGVNTEAKLLLLTHAFETLGCISVLFETSWFNHRSRTAIARLGAKQDGVLRNHKRHTDGSPRDTVVFSIIDGEWPAVKRNLLAKLARHEQDSP